ncbi:MAG: PAS domain S-box protein, partial [Spirochaetes bacterium]|nr:PAS domain S-box protein [Spirochaetota bacterium]
MEENALPNHSLETLFESRWLYIVEVDAERRIQRSNTAARELLGIEDTDDSRDIGTTALAALELPAGITEQSLHTHLHGEITQSLELVTPSGLVRWFEWRVSQVYDDAQNLQGFLCIGIDISRRRRAEERIRVFFDESKDMIFTCTPDDRIAEINPAGVRLLGSRNAASLIQRKITDFYVSVADREFYRTRMRADGYVKDLELFMRREDGTRLVVLETSTAVKDSDGNILEYHGIIKDISERIRLEQEHMKMNIELAETNRKLRHTQSRLVQQEKLASVGRLAAGLAHEINNPLSFVKSNFDSLREYVRRLSQHMDSRNDSALPAEIAHILSDLDTLFDESEHGFERMVSIVQGLRNFARTGKGRREEYSINTAVETTLTILRNEYKRLADVDLHLGEIPAVLCYPDEINQV